MRLTLLIFAIVALQVSTFAQNTFYAKAWSKVYKNEIKDLPKSALKIVDSIYYKAKEDNNITEITKALLYQSKFTLALQENSELAVIEKFKKEIEVSNAPLSNLLESMLAQIYWQYFQFNRYKYYNRTAVSETVNPGDLRTWDASAMVREIELHFRNSLLNASVLKNTKLENFDNILALAEQSKRYRPTLYDFLANYALDFYAADERGLRDASMEASISMSDYFPPMDDVKFSDTVKNGKYQALKIFRDLLVFHKERRDTNAYVNMEIERLKFVNEHSAAENDAELLKSALRNLLGNHDRHPASSLIKFELASIAFKEGEQFDRDDTTHRWKKKIAVEICNEVLSQHPLSDGATRCEALRDHILSGSLSIEAEKFFPVSRPSRMRVTFTNQSSIYTRIYNVSNSFEKIFYEAVNDSARIALLANRQTHSAWHTDLPSMEDYQTHTTELIIPALERGNYIIVVTKKQDIADENSFFAFASVCITDLSLLEIASEARYRFQLVDRNNGRPISGADIHLKSVPWATQDQLVDVHLLTDKDGFVEFDKTTNRGYTLEANVAYREDTVLFSTYYYYNYRYDRRQPEEGITAQAFVFTDRSIYRPGQTVFFKGILVKKKEKTTSIVAGEYVEVLLEDPNDREIASLELKTNRYGSFSGEFKLPATGITGEYRITVDEGYEEDSKFYDNLTNFEYSDAQISVEEYKRPTFEVLVKPLTGTLKLNDTIRVTGNASAYSGSKISKAKVTYTVQREVTFPRWDHWRSNPYYSPSHRVAHGEIETDGNGNFIIPFKAIPDDKILPGKKPVFRYSISVSVTDLNGETRNAESHVNVGYHSMIATIKAAEEMDVQKQNSSLSVVTENLNGQFLRAKGTIKVYKLQGPMHPQRGRVWEAPDVPIIAKADFEKLFPNDPYGDGSTHAVEWEKAKLVKELSFDTQTSKELNLGLDKTWSLGAYRMELQTKDSVGQLVEDQFMFEVTDSKGKSVPDNTLLVFQADKNSYRVGEVAKIKIGSACKDVFVTIEVEKDKKIVKTLIEPLSANTKEISIPVTEVMDGSFSVHCSATIYNSFIQREKTLAVEKDQAKLTIETETFKDKLQPGAKETWSFLISGPNDQKVESEMLASMYDASLDQFKHHEWNFDPIEKTYYHSGYRIGFGQSFGTTDFIVHNLPPNYLSIPQQNYDALDWFGFNITNQYYIKRKYLDRLYFEMSSTGKASKVTMGHNRNAQEGFISGRITGEDGEPLPGVNVVVKGTTRGTITDAEGYYSLPAGKDDVLQFTFVGFVSAEVKAGRKNMVNVSMQPDIMQLSEVVVVGYGVQQQVRSLGSAVSHVYSDTTASDDVVFQEALEGRAVGVMLQAPSATYHFTIRGNSSIASGNLPLYVVDGVIVESSTIAQDDLASAQVLKGAAATALYGSRAVNGVIIISTKSGQQKIDNELAKVAARKNFNETAFFFPHLTTDENGKIRFSFTSPESLTRWKLQLLAHTKDLLTATKTLQSVTQKDMMVTPNLPRFVRVNDEVIISAKISNLSTRKLDGKITLLLTDPTNGQSVDQLFFNIVRNQTFKTDAKGNTQISWSIKIPEGIDAVQYKIVAKAGNFSDGEQNVLPVLPNRMLVTETLPLYIRSNQTKTFSLTKLQTHSSPTLKHHQLTLEVTSNPAWYAIQSLPYLMEFPHECAEQLFSRIYANSIASHVVNANPKIKAVFDKWAGSGKLTSNLENNQELKSIILEETPWLRDAESEAEQKKRMALLFDLNTMSDQLNGAVDKLKEMQFAHGGFPWFEGGRYTDRFITQHVASGFGHLVKLNISVNDELKMLAEKSVGYLDGEMTRDYNELVKRAGKSAAESKSNQNSTTALTDLNAYTPSPMEVHYLYMRSFYPHLIRDENLKKAIAFLQKQTEKKWVGYPLYQKGMLALIHYRAGNKILASDILASLRENAIISDELGMYWKENVGGWYWYEGAVETQALMVEAFAEIQSGEPKLSSQEKQNTIDELRIWLLKNKQTNSWRTTKATTEAAYALLLHGADWLALENSVSLTVGRDVIDLSSKEVETGTGYFKTSWKGEEISREMSNVTISKNDEGIAWGGMYWQYFEDLDKITSAETPLKLKKNVFKVLNTNQGEKLSEIKNENLKPGDLIRVRIELSVDRPMEYLHMKDMRAAGFEPVNVLSAYKWQEGLGYYQSTRDVATNFFFDQVKKGVYVFEYDLRVNVKGNFSNGIATIQSMYAPEFSSHSEGIRVMVE